MKLFLSTKNKSKDRIDENASHFEINEVVLVNLYIVNNDYQQDSRVLYEFVSNKSFGKFLDISSKKFVFVKTFNAQFSHVEE